MGGDSFRFELPCARGLRLCTMCLVQGGPQGSGGGLSRPPATHTVSQIVAGWNRLSKVGGPTACRILDPPGVVEVAACAWTLTTVLVSRCACLAMWTSARLCPNALAMAAKHSQSGMAMEGSMTCKWCQNGRRKSSRHRVSLSCWSVRANKSHCLERQHKQVDDARMAMRSIHLLVCRQNGQGEAVRQQCCHGPNSRTSTLLLVPLSIVKKFVHIAAKQKGRGRSPTASASGPTRGSLLSHTAPRCCDHDLAGCSSLAPLPPHK